jgi:hypothetical protein
MNELLIQAALVKAANDAGGHGFKCSNAFTVGVADLSLVLPGYSHWFLEVKFLRGLRLSERYPLELTAHQSKFLREVQQAGGCAGWILAVEVKSGTGRVAMQVGTDHEADHVLMASPLLVDLNVDPARVRLFRDRGGAWPIVAIMQRLLVSHEMSRHKTAIRACMEA